MTLPFNKQVFHHPGMDVGIDTDRFEGRIDWQALFGNSNPVVVEIGCGKGRFIIRSAMENPSVNYLGIEKSGKYYRITRERAMRSGAENIKLAWGEAAHFLQNCIPPSSVSAYHIYFPDPWPKKRHRKRRLVNSCFVDILSVSLVSGGTVSLATDFEDYFDQMLEVCDICSGIEQVYNRVILPRQADPEQAFTNYERKYLIQGRKIYKAAYRKR